MPALAPQPAPGLLPAPPAGPPWFKATFNGAPGKLAYFLNQIWSHLDCYGALYQSDQEIISAVVDNMMDREAAEWLAQLPSEGGPELDNANEFIGILFIGIHTAAKDLV